MFTKILIVIAILVCLVNGSNCDSIDDLVKKLTPKIECISHRIASAITNGQKNSEQSRVHIETLLDNFEKQLISEKAVIPKLIETFEKDAETSKGNIAVCIRTAFRSLKKLDGSQFSKCNSRKVLNDVPKYLDKLKNSETILKASPVKCARKANRNLKKCKKCILDTMKNVEIQTDKAVVKINLIIGKARGKVETCAIKRSVERYQMIKEAVSDLNDCVSKRL